MSVCLFPCWLILIILLHFAYKLHDIVDFILFLFYLSRVYNTTKHGFACHDLAIRRAVWRYLSIQKNESLFVYVFVPLTQLLLVLWWRIMSGAVLMMQKVSLLWFFPMTGIKSLQLRWFSSKRYFFFSYGSAINDYFRLYRHLWDSKR